MAATYFFALGLVNSISLTLIFLLRESRLEWLSTVSWAYLLLALPAAYGIVLVHREGATIRYSIFLGLFLAFLLMEWLLDFVLKIDFRANLMQHLGWAVPYLALYYATNYGFVVMPWKTDATRGKIMLALFIVQLAVNIWSHP